MKGWKKINFKMKVLKEGKEVEVEVPARKNRLTGQIHVDPSDLLKSLELEEIPPEWVRVEK